MKKSLLLTCASSNGNCNVDSGILPVPTKTFPTHVKASLMVLLIFLTGISSIAASTVNFDKGATSKYVSSENIKISKDVFNRLGNLEISWWSPNGFVSFYANPERASSLFFSPPPSLSLDGQQTNVSCNGGSNGTAAVSATAGSAPYTYSWSIGAQTTQSVSGLSAGSYTVTVTDANSDQENYVFAITQPSALSITPSQTNIACNGGAAIGTATVSVSGGTPGYTYSWTPGGNTTATKTGLAVGSYTCTVTDANSCSAVQTFSITQPAVFSWSSNSRTNISCNGANDGSATINVTGGATP